MDTSIEIRNLEGESITLLLASHISIAQLKNILKASFPPATNAPNFHLFYKGCKLSLNSRLDGHQISNGEFIVLIPFVKRSKQLSSPQQLEEKSKAPSVSFPKSSSMSPAAYFTWLHTVDELSPILNIAQDIQIPNNSSPNKLTDAKSVLLREASGKNSTRTKRERGIYNNPAVLHNLLGCDSINVFHIQTFAKISPFIDLVNCLSNPVTYRCLLFERSSEKFGKGSCLCPSWLKKVLKCYSFLNILYAFFHAQSQCLTWTVIEEALQGPGPSGLDEICISDVKNLSILCPKVVVALDEEKFTTVKLGYAIAITNSSVESAVSSTPTKKRKIVRKQTSTLVNAIEEREVAFRTDLWRLIKYCMDIRQPALSLSFAPSIEDLLSLIKDGVVVPGDNVAKPAKSGPLASRCHDMKHLEPSDMVDHLSKGLGWDGQVVHVEYINAKEAVYAELPNDLSDNTRAALQAIGISRLYSHQAKAIQASLCGKNVVVATSTSSGKSLCYNIPVLEALSTNLLACALYIFPTKALAQDQLRALLGISNGLNIELSIGVYDGDTSQKDRSWIRNNARLLITNPDMLHTSILPYHANFGRILSNLRTIVIDEAHVYKGAFGCHTALVLRRLRRICSHVYGSEPSFIFSTATSADPREHAMELTNLQNVELIHNDGSPSSKKYFLFWNPSVGSESNMSCGNRQESVKEKLGTKGSRPLQEASSLFAEMVQHGLQCIAFCKTRKLAELVMFNTREILEKFAPSLADSICVYRGGYTAEDRRKIERDFFGGKLLGVAATNALELGIDVGHIDATLHLGFPGSVASLWQQAGRSGRRLRPSLAIYIAFGGPLDQYFMKFPHKLFQRTVERCQVDGQNQKVLEQHVACAARELPLSSQYDEKYFGSGLDGAITALRSKGILGSAQIGGSSIITWNYIGYEDSPSKAISLRAIETEKYKVIDQRLHIVLEEIEESTAFFQVYEGAAYMHQGYTYLVKTLDLSKKLAFCQKADLKYYTKTRDYTDIHVIGGDIAYPPVRESEFENVGTTAQVHSCKVTTKWFGFYRIWRSGLTETVDLLLPEFSYESQAAWVRVPHSIKEAVEIEDLTFRAGLHAASHALLNVVPLYVMCNSSDLSTECANPHETRSIPERLLLYDKHPGGVGLAAQVQLLFRELLAAALELVSTCTCSSPAGCPNCVQAFSCSEYNEVLDKKAAIIILKSVTEAENSYFKSK